MENYVDVKLFPRMMRKKKCASSEQPFIPACDPISNYSTLLATCYRAAFFFSFVLTKENLIPVLQNEDIFFSLRIYQSASSGSFE
jgi:hypothetical protein